MKEVSAVGGIVVLYILLAVALIFGGFWTYAYFNPRYVAVQNRTFHESQQYNDGMQNRLEQYQEAYMACTSQACKDNIRSMVRHDFASYPADRLNPQLRSFYEQMTGGL